MGSYANQSKTLQSSPLEKPSDRLILTFAGALAQLQRIRDEQVGNQWADAEKGLGRFLYRFKATHGSLPQSNACTSPAFLGTRPSIASARLPTACTDHEMAAKHSDSFL